MRITNLIIAFVLALGIILPLGNNEASAASSYNFNDVALDKTFEIKFNQKLDSASVTNESIKVTKSDKTSVPIIVSYSDSSKSIKVKPKTTYALDSSYTLTISTNVKSKNKVKLKNAVTVSFTTVGDDDLMVDGVVSGESYIEELEKKLSNSNNSQTSAYVKESTKNFNFNFTAKAYKEGKYLVAEAEKVVKEYESFFGEGKLKDKVDVWVYDDEGIFNYMNSTFYSTGDDTIVFALSSILREGNNPKFTLAHEIVHALQKHTYSDMQWGAEKTWFTEGQADYLAKQVLGLPQYPHEPSGVSNWTKSFYLKEFSSRYNGWKKRDWSRYKKITDLNLDSDDYFSFHALVYFLEETYGRTKYKEFSDKMGANVAPTQAFQQVYDKTEEQLMSEYKSFFNVTK